MKKIMTAMLFAVVLGVIMGLAGCGVRQPGPDEIPLKMVSDGARVKVERIATIHDTLAYGNIRGVYVITDKDTSKQYIGISGIGISELGQHTSGKTQAQDER